MKFRLSTIFLLLTIIALGVGWYGERLRTTKATEKWAIEKQKLIDDNSARVESIIFGTEALGTSQRTIDLLDQVGRASAAPNKENRFGTGEVFYQNIARHCIIHLWRNEKNIHLTLDEISPDWRLRKSAPHHVELTNRLLKRIECSSAGDLANHRSGQNFESEPFDKWNDANSPTFNSLDEFISKCLGFK